MIKWSHSKSSDGTQTISAALSSDLVHYFDAKLQIEIIEKMAEKYVELNYDELVKLVDKDTIVREVSVQISENILSKIYGNK